MVRRKTKHRRQTRACARVFDFLKHGVSAHVKKGGIHRILSNRY